MESSKLAVKFFFQDGSAPHSEAVVPVFHRWIQNHAVAEHQLVDVADYQHVVAGPGTVLVAHEANISTDQSENRPGLLYIRKTPLTGDFTQRLLDVFGYTLQLCKLLEDDTSTEPRAKFRTDNPIIRIYDRLAAPNTPETFAALKPALTSVAQRLFAASVQLTYAPGEKTLFEVGVKASSNDSVTSVLSRLQKTPAEPYAEPPEYSL